LAKKNFDTFSLRRQLEGKEKLDWETIKVLLCREFGWTAEEFSRQPLSFILRALKIMEIESKYAKY